MIWASRYSTLNPMIIEQLVCILKIALESRTLLWTNSNPWLFLFSAKEGMALRASDASSAFIKYEFVHFQRYVFFSISTWKKQLGISLIFFLTRRIARLQMVNWSALLLFVCSISTVPYVYVQLLCFSCMTWQWNISWILLQLATYPKLISINIEFHCSKSDSNLLLKLSVFSMGLAS